MKNKIISDATIKRLPRYYRYLKQLDMQGIKKVSSSDIANEMDVSSSQVRQDFFGFECLGQQGYGYDVKHLKGVLAKALGLGNEYKMIVLGAGHIGGALAGYKGFIQDGFKITAFFDVIEKEKELYDIPVYSVDVLEKYLKENDVDIAVIATPAKAAQEMVNKVISLGIKTIWNFAPIEIKVPNGIVIENISMLESLLVLSYKANNRN